jgi:hypothetical protein
LTTKLAASTGDKSRLICAPSQYLPRTNTLAFVEKFGLRLCDSWPSINQARFRFLMNVSSELCGPTIFAITQGVPLRRPAFRVYRRPDLAASGYRIPLFGYGQLCWTRMSSALIRPLVTCDHPDCAKTKTGKTPKETASTAYLIAFVPFTFTHLRRLTVCAKNRRVLTYV